MKSPIRHSGEVERAGQLPPPIAPEWEASLRVLLESTPYGKLVADSEGCIQMVNRNLCAMLGYERSELLGQPLEMMLPARYRAHHLGLRQGFMQSPSPRTMGAGRDLTAMRKDGCELPVEVGIAPLETSAGRLVLAAVVDITLRKQVENRLREANAQLEEFSYVSSHDLRAPIHGICSLLEWVREDLEGTPVPASVRHNLGRMETRLRRMEQLIADMLAYAHSGSNTRKTKEIDLAELIEEIAEMEPVPQRMRLDKEMCVGKLHGAAVPLRTVVRNLYSNAIKHHDKPDGWIRVAAREEGIFCVISIADNGPGIPKPVHERIFRLFQTLTSSERKSSGLGLAVAKRLAESHGGRIELISDEEHPGSTFEVWWPRIARTDLND